MGELLNYIFFQSIIACTFKMLTKKKKKWFSELSSRRVSHIMKSSPNRNFQLLLTNLQYLRASTYKYIKSLIMCLLIYSVTLKPVGVSYHHSPSGSNLLPLPGLPRTPSYISGKNCIHISTTNQSLKKGMRPQHLP